ncbi:MAG: hypothetical protein VX777_10330 [Chlamydiota bacterium]|nr:hypothetical protein [Chlamydiota bacterium]
MTIQSPVNFPSSVTDVYTNDTVSNLTHQIESIKNESISDIETKLKNLRDNILNKKQNLQEELSALESLEKDLIFEKNNTAITLLGEKTSASNKEDSPLDSLSSEEKPTNQTVGLWGKVVTIKNLALRNLDTIFKVANFVTIATGMGLSVFVLQKVQEEVHYLHSDLHRLENDSDALRTYLKTIAYDGISVRGDVSATVNNTVKVKPTNRAW